MRGFSSVGLAVAVLLSIAINPVWAESPWPIFPWDTGPGTLAWAIAAPDGSRVYLSGICVRPGSIDGEAGHFYVREPWERLDEARLIRIESRVLVADWQTLDIEGQIWTVDG